MPDAGKASPEYDDKDNAVCLNFMMAIIFNIFRTIEGS
jgi:hypothetical protein